jgi:hypothetical protein
LAATSAGGTSTTYNTDNAQTNFNGTSLTFQPNGNVSNDGTNTNVERTRRLERHERRGCRQRSLRSKPLDKTPVGGNSTGSY